MTNVAFVDLPSVHRAAVRAFGQIEEQCHCGVETNLLSIDIQAATGGFNLIFRSTSRKEASLGRACSN